VADLAAITAAQQEWLKRLDAAREKSNAVMACFRMLEQEMARLQDNSQASAETLAELLGGQSQLRTDLGERISQGVQFLRESLVGILETRASQGDPVDGVETDAQPPTEDISWAIDQLTRRSAGTDGPPSIL
jgi:hypothetical protein